MKHLLTALIVMCVAAPVFAQETTKYDAAHLARPCNQELISSGACKDTAKTITLSPHFFTGSLVGGVERPVRDYTLTRQTFLVRANRQARSDLYLSTRRHAVGLQTSQTVRVRQGVSVAGQD